jgi:hypothetical protein
MRFYSFTNMYTSGIHAGIQTAHAVHSMMSKYRGRDGSPPKELKLIDWADDHQTIIVLNGGYHENLNAIYEQLKPISAELELPIIKWAESKAALNGATTAVGIVVPQSIYDLDRDGIFESPDGPVASLYKLINSYRFAT